MDLDPDAAALRALGAARGNGLAMFTGWRAYSMRPWPTTITTQPQFPVRIERMIVAPGTGDRWIIDKLAVGNLAVIFESIEATVFDPTRNQPGPFDIEAIPTAMAGMNISLDVRYVGDDPEGEVFRGAVLCRRADAPLSRTAALFTLPIDSGRRIVGTRSLRVLVGLDDKTWMFEENGGRLSNVYPREPDEGEVDSLEIEMIENRLSAAPGLLAIPVPPTARLTLERFRHPMMVALHVAQIDLAPLPRRVLFGTDERTGQVVFEVGDSANLEQAPSFAFKYALEGYKPWWWERWTLLETDLLVPA